MKRNVIASATVAILTALIVTWVLARPSTQEPAAADTPGAGAVAAAEVVVREDSHRLSTAPAGSPVFVEFLDLECEACRAAYPMVEQLREDYAGRVEFVIRYFPIESHANAVNAAVAVEAAARQGKLEGMYSRMYEIQDQWGEQPDSQAPLFRQFAQELGLDLEAFDADVASADVRARVEKDRKDGVTLGVQGTPTFFLDAQMIRPQSEEELRRMLDDALAR